MENRRAKAPTHILVSLDCVKGMKNLTPHILAFNSIWEYSLSDYVGVKYYDR